MRPGLQALALPTALALATALAWVLLFELNAWLFSSLEANPYVNWVFLPAAIRLLAVLWLGWTGAAGLFVGAIATGLDTWATDPGVAITLSALSALPCLLAVTAVGGLLRLPMDLAGLRAWHLLALSMAGSAASVAAHTGYFMLRAGDTSPAAGVMPMFVGDTVGTAIVLAAAAALLRRLPSRARS